MEKLIYLTLTSVCSTLIAANTLAPADSFISFMLAVSLYIAARIHAISYNDLQEKENE